MVNSAKGYLTCAGKEALNAKQLTQSNLRYPYSYVLDVLQTRNRNLKKH